MALSAFDDASRCPEPAEIEKALGETATLRARLVSHVAERHPPITEQWSHAGKKFGWSMRLKRKERVVLYMTPQLGHFMVGVVLGERAAKAAHEAGLPDGVLALIDNAPAYAEGRGIRVPVTSEDDLAPVRQLVAIKLAR